MSTSARNISAPAVSAPVSALPTATVPAEEPLTETIIEPVRGWIGVDWKEMARARELLFFLVWRDVKVRYKQATLGVAWSLLVPLAQVAIYTLIFSSGFSLASRLGPKFDPSQYPIYIFSAMLAWQMINRSLTDGGLSLINQQHLLTKIYFPRLFVPTASVGGAVFDMLITLPVFIGAMVLYRVVPSWGVIFFPVLMLQTAMLGAGLAYLLSALTVSYRDFRFIIPIVSQIWMWLSFVMLPVPDHFITSWKWNLLLHLNPVYGIVATVRKMMISSLDHGWDITFWLSSMGMTVLIFAVGVFYFRKTERRFADIA